MSRTLRIRRLSVCLLSSHPVVLEEFHRLLSEPRFLVRPILVEPDDKHDLENLPVPPASVYAIDSNGSSTASLVAGLLNRFPKARVLVLARQFNEVNSYAYLQLGAKGLLSYSQASRHLPKAVQTVAQNGFWVERSLLSRFVDSMLSTGRSRHLASGTARLSPRQKEVLEGLLQNLSNKEIADKIHRSERTAKFHVSSLLAKFGVHRREELVALYYQARIREPVKSGT